MQREINLLTGVGRTKTQLKKAVNEVARRKRVLGKVEERSKSVDGDVEETRRDVLRDLGVWWK